MSFLTSKFFWETPKNNTFIYGLIDPRTQEIKYIGKTVQGIERLRQHFYSSGNRKYEGNTKKINWCKKLKSLGLIFDVIYLEYIENDYDLNEAESFYIQYFKSLGAELLNHTNGGEESFKRKYTEEEKKQISIKTKLAMSKPEVKLKMSLSHLGKPSSMKGKTHTSESIKKIKKANEKKSIQVIDSNENIYKSLLEASIKNNCTPTDIRRCLLNPNKKINGLTFRRLCATNSTS